LTETIRLFRKQWNEFVESVASVAWQPAYAGVSRTSKIGINEGKNTSLPKIKKVGEEIIEKGSSHFVKVDKTKIIETTTVDRKGGETIVAHALQKHARRF
jgi:hypothetical protein